MAITKQKIYVKTLAKFNELLGAGEITGNHLVYIEEGHRIWTHGQFFSSDGFKSISDGTQTASSNSVDGTITFTGTGKANVTVGAGGVTVNVPATTFETGDGNGQIKIDGQNVSIKGLGTAAYTNSTAYATAAQGTKADNAVPKTTTVNGHALSGNVTVSAEDVGLGNVTNESKETMFASAALTGTPTAPTATKGTKTTQIATTAFVDAAITDVLAASDAMVFKGTLGTGGTITALPAKHQVGDTYKAIAGAPAVGGKNLEVGDMVICIKTGTAAADADWVVTQTNIDGAVVGPASSVDNQIAVFDGTTGKIIKDSGFTIATSVPEDAVFTDTTYTAGTGIDINEDNEVSVNLEDITKDIKTATAEDDGFVLASDARKIIEDNEKVTAAALVDHEDRILLLESWAEY